MIRTVDYDYLVLLIRAYEYLCPPNLTYYLFATVWKCKWKNANEKRNTKQSFSPIEYCIKMTKDDATIQKDNILPKMQLNIFIAAVQRISGLPFKKGEKGPNIELFTGLDIDFELKTLTKTSLREFIQIINLWVIRLQIYLKNIWPLPYPLFVKNWEYSYNVLTVAILAQGGVQHLSMSVEQLS